MFRENRFFRNLGSFAKLRNSRKSSLIFAKHENRFVASFAKFSRNEISSKTLSMTAACHVMLHVHVHAAYLCVHAACPCCVHAACPCYMPFMHVNPTYQHYRTMDHVLSSCPCPCPYVHVFCAFSIKCVHRCYFYVKIILLKCDETRKERGSL